MQTYLLFQIATNVADTSKQSYHQLKLSGRFKNIKQYVLYALSKSPKPLTNRMLSRMSGIDTSSLTAPIKELILDGTIKEVGKAKNDTGLCAKAYVIS